MADTADDPIRFQYNRGAIVRIKLSNFMTYRACEFRPGPRLNLLLGANGTGKSSVVCALALGFFGSPKILGRQSSVQEFIRQGQKKGFIELEIYSGSEAVPNTVLRRVITRAPEGESSNTTKKGKRTKASDGKTEWWIDGHRATPPEVKKMLNEFSIQVDNMCQFLPQDKVGEFSGFDRYELFRETIRASLGDEYVKKMEFLADAQKQVREQQTRYDNESRNLQHMKDEKDKYEAVVKQQKEREAMETKLDLCAKKIPWVKFEEKRVVATELKGKKKDAETAVRKLEENAPELTNEHLALRKVQKELDKKHKKSQDKEKQDLGRMVKQISASTSQAKKVVMASKALSRMDAAYQDAVDEHDKAKEELELVCAKLEKVPQFDKEAHSEVVAASRKASDDAQRAQRAAEAVTREMNPIQAAITRKKQQLQKLQRRSEKDIRGLYVKNYFYDAGEQHLTYVRRNERRFQSQVYGPIAWELKAKNELIAHQVENALPFVRRKFYVTQCKADSDMLAKDKSAPSFINVNPESIDKEVYRLFPKELLNSLGIDGYLDEFIVAPEVVLHATYRMQKLNRQLTAPNLQDKDIERVFKELRKVPGCPPILTIYTKTSKAQSQQSNYSNNEVITVEEMKPYRRQIRVEKNDTSESFGGEDEQELLENIASQEEELNSLAVKKNEYVKKASEFKKQTEELATKKAELVKVKSKFNELTSKKVKLEVKVDSLKQRVDQDWDAQKLESKKKRSKFLLEHLDLVNQAMDYSEDVLDQSIIGMEVNMKKIVNKCELEVVEEGIKNHEKELAFANQTLSDVKEEFKEVKEELKELLNEAKNACDLTDELKKEFESLPNGLEELNATIVDLQSVLNAMSEQKMVVRKYNELVQQIAELEPKVMELKEKLETFDDQLLQIRTEFDGPVQKIIQRLRQKFEELFEFVHDAGYSCQGTLEWIKDDGNNPQKFGIGIKVKFREEQPLAYLSSSVQSGGERSLSTFLYVLALQRITHCPFRLVDEINQGMDAVKERLAFKCLTKESCGSNHAQYFLVTPKLLRNLEYTDDMTILFVFNGNHVPNNEDFDFRKFLQAKLGGVSDENGSSKKRVRVN